MLCIICQEKKVNFRIEPACPECKKFIENLGKIGERNKKQDSINNAARRCEEIKGQIASLKSEYDRIIQFIESMCKENNLSISVEFN